MRSSLFIFLFFAVPTVDHDVILAVFVTTDTTVFAADTLLHNTLHLSEREKGEEKREGGVFPFLSTLLVPSLTTLSPFSFFVQFRNFKIVYRRYAGLFFCICVDLEDSNLGYLEAIHNFVEV